MLHACFILNHTVNALIAYAVPMNVLTGVTQNISPLLQFEWYKPVYYHEEVTGFLSQSKESFGWFVGIAETVGHALSFMILTKDTQKILFRFIVCTATDPLTTNLRAKGYPKEDP